jgi:hypothetical protein
MASLCMATDSVTRQFLALPFLYSYGALNFHVRGANCVPKFLQLYPVAQNYFINSSHIMGGGRNSLKIGTAEIQKNRNCRTPQEPELSDPKYHAMKCKTLVKIM